MSRFDTRGTTICIKCVNHRKSNTCPHYRCDYPDNLGSNWLGTTYMRRPDDINYNNKCEWFKANENQKEN